MREIVSPLDGFGSPFGARRRVGPVVSGVQATGGTETVITQNGNFYRVHTFLTSGTFTVTQGGDVEYLVVAGGGGAGGRTGGNGGGGGAGGLLSSTANVSTGALSVSVGAGGAGGSAEVLEAGIDGENSSFNSIVAFGGGGGAAGTLSAKSGGSGGGASPSATTPGSGITGQGFAGGNHFGPAGDLGRASGGGGGAGGAGGNASSSTAGLGGAGVNSSINGTTQTYAEGGRGSNVGTNQSPFDQPPNTGNGGRATIGTTAGDDVRRGGNGGSGIVIIRYEITEAEYLAEL